MVLSLVNPGKNKGYAGGCNYGAKYAKEGLLVFLNNDTEVEQDWLTNLIETISKDSNISSVQPN